MNAARHPAARARRIVAGTAAVATVGLVGGLVATAPPDTAPVDASLDQAVAAETPAAPTTTTDPESTSTPSTAPATTTAPRAHTRSRAS